MSVTPAAVSHPIQHADTRGTGPRYVSQDPPGTAHPPAALFGEVQDDGNERPRAVPRSKEPAR